MKYLNPKQRRLLLLTAITLWLISLPLPVFIFGQNHDYDGITTLWLGTIFGFTTREIGYYAVYANYIWLFIVITLMFRPRSRTTGSILNACLWAVALLTFTLDERVEDNFIVFSPDLKNPKTQSSALNELSCIKSTASRVPACRAETMAVISSVEVCTRLARCRTSSATTAKPKWQSKSKASVR